jgi:imidazolonepropionase-like amidohydrolase
LASWILISGASVIDGTGGPPQPGASVLLKDNRIAAVGEDISTEELVPRGEHVHVIDATGKTVMPGMIDAHCHISFGEARTQEEQDLYTSPESRTLRSAWNAKKILRAGFTGISAPGGSWNIGVAVREGIDAGMVEGPRTTTGGRFITTSNGISDFYPTWVGVPESSIGVLANTKDEMITEVRKQVKNGVDLVKLGDSPYGDYLAFTYDEIAAMTDMVHQLKRRVTIHARGAEAVAAAVRAGVDWVMHGDHMTDEEVGMLAESGIPLCPTITLLCNFSDWGALAGVSSKRRDGAKRLLDKSATALTKAREAGVRFLIGTDTGFAITPFGEWHAREMEMLVKYAGLTPLQTIQAATQNGAKVLNLEGQVGVVAPDMLADVIVVDGDPSKDIRVLQDKRRIHAVIKDGQIVEFDAETETRRWPYDRAQIISGSEITYDLVYGEGPPRAPDPIGWSADEQGELAFELRAQELAARDEQPSDNR